MKFSSLLTIGLTALVASFAQAQNAPLRLEITQGVIEPMPVAIPFFTPQGPQAATLAQDISRVIAADLSGTGLFREIPHSAHIAKVTNFDAPISYADWKAVNAQALLTGAVALDGNLVTVKFRLFDVVSGQPAGEGLQLSGTAQDWRRIAHKVSDTIYARLTGETAYFDSRIAFISESGPKNRRQKRLAIMDYDGANVQMLTDGRATALAPRFSPDNKRILFTSYAGGFPRIAVMDLTTRRVQALAEQPGTMTFSPRFSPDGQRVVFSLSQNGNTDLYMLDLASGQRSRLTDAPSIETAPSFSPDGSRIVFESDRSGTQQLYVMAASGGTAQRISSGQGRYSTPVWSPRGDLVAFTKQNAGRFHIGVMRVDGSQERLLTASFLDEGPSWSPNGRVITFTRESAGTNGMAQIYTVDISGRNLRPVKATTAGSDPSWSALLP